MEKKPLEDLTNKKNKNGKKKPLHSTCHNCLFLAADLAIMRYSLSALSESSQLQITLPIVGQRTFKPRVLI